MYMILLMSSLRKKVSMAGWRFVAFIIMKWIESTTNIALCEQVALDSVLETSYEHDTVKEFTTRPQEQFLPYDGPQQPSQYQENTPGQAMKGSSFHGAWKD